MNFGELLFFGSLVALANVVGGLLLARPGTFERSRKFLSYLVALGAGFMMAAIFIEIVPEVVVLWPQGGAGNSGKGVLGAMTLLLAGYLLIHFFEHTIAPHFHFGEETHPEAVVRSSAAYTAIGGLSIHTFFDGASV
ncbi:MAG: zinc and cadmium transporter, partial [Acidobacteriota bacterium]|nr:zinc and cadmium transporter [Acidobacteriota bacterium]